MAVLTGVDEEDTGETQLTTLLPLLLLTVCECGVWVCEQEECIGFVCACGICIRGRATELQLAQLSITE